MTLTGTTIDIRSRRIAATAAVGYVVLFLLSQTLPSALGQNKNTHIITPYSSDADVTRYLSAVNHHLLPIGAFCQALSALALLAFAPYAADYIRRCVPGTALAGLARASGTTAAALLLISASAQWVLLRPSTLTDLRVYRAISDLVFVTGAGPQVATTGLLVGAVAAAGLRARSLPKWLNWFGLAIAAVSLASMLSLLSEPATYCIPLGRYMGFAWFAGTAAALLRHRRLSSQQ
ncbi:hypothetical protein [Nocardia sp. NPDC020380]|uniref:hypothetical protein n=1 Tax=Nocardia sp. NPDC020380 TaxID=3364309 RepID=UPI0037B964FE